MKKILCGIMVSLVCGTLLHAQDYLLSYIKCENNNDDYTYSWHWFDPATNEDVFLLDDMPADIVWDMKKKEVYYILNDKVYKNTWPRIQKKPVMLSEFPSSEKKNIWIDDQSGKLRREYLIRISTPELNHGDLYTCYVDEYGEKDKWINICKSKVEIGDYGRYGFEEVNKLMAAGRPEHQNKLLEDREYNSVKNKITVFPLTTKDEHETVREKTRGRMELSSDDELVYVPLDMEAEQLSKTKGSVFGHSKYGVVLSFAPGVGDTIEDDSYYCLPILLWNGTSFVPVNSSNSEPLGIYLDEKYFLYNVNSYGGPLGLCDRKAGKQIFFESTAINAVLVPK
jgi:hypothetical protein